MVRAYGRRAGANSVDEFDTDLLDTNEIFFGLLESTPSDSAIPSGQTAIYYKSGEPETLYQRPYGGTESAVGGGSGSDTRTDVSDDGTQIVADTSDINFSTDLNVSNDGDGSVTVESAASGGSGLSTTVVDSASTTTYTTNDEASVTVTAAVEVST